MTTWVEDRAAIHDLVVRHAWAVDSWDVDAVVDCYCPDGCLESAAGADVSGAQELRAFYSRGRSGGRFATMGERTLISTSHVMGNILAAIDGDSATARSACTSFTVVRDQGHEYLVATGLRYTDLCRRLPTGWRIAHRTLELDWTFDVSVHKLTDPRT